MSQILKTATNGPLTGYREVPVDIVRLVSFKQKAYDAKVPYLWAGKDSHLGSGVIDFPDGIDCSGWFRTLTDYITHNILRTAGLPDGSYTQSQWLMKQGFKYHAIHSAADYHAYADVNDDLYRVGFHYPGGRGGDAKGHVWADVHAHSVESYGGHGPGERSIDHQWFIDHCDLIVVIGRMFSASDWADPKLNAYSVS